MDKNFTTSIAKYLNRLNNIAPVPTGTQSKIDTSFKAKAIIFDIYGTLLVSASGDIDQAQVKTDYLKLGLQEAGIKCNDDSEAFLNALLDKFKKTIRCIHTADKEKGIAHPEIDIEKIWQIVIREYEDKGLLSTSRTTDFRILTVIYEIHSNPVWPMPDMKKVLQMLSDKGIVLGIVSNAQFYTPLLMNYFIKDTIDENEIIHFFNEDLSVYSYKNGMAKPSVELYNQLIPVLKDKYNIDPQEAVFVGNDMLNDIYAADKAGLKTALFAGDTRSLRLRKDKEQCKNLQADFIINDLNELLQII